jgi:hypothetical protein
MRTRDEHLEWCKRRALEYLEAGDILKAVGSMGSGLMDHKELKDISVSMAPVGLFYAVNGDFEGARHWIEGFR